MLTERALPPEDLMLGRLNEEILRLETIREAMQGDNVQGESDFALDGGSGFRGPTTTFFSGPESWPQSG